MYQVSMTKYNFGLCVTCLFVKTATVSQIILARMLKFFSSKDNLIDWICNGSRFDAVHARIIADMSIANDWQGIRYNK